MARNTTSGGAKKTDKQNLNSKLIEQEKINGTPFTAIKYNDKWYLTLGKYRLTEEKKTLREVIKESKNASWERVMQIIQIMIDENKKEPMTTTKINNQLNLND